MPHESGGSFHLTRTVKAKSSTPERGSHELVEPVHSGPVPARRRHPRRAVLLPVRDEQRASRTRSEFSLHSGHVPLWAPELGRRRHDGMAKRLTNAVAAVPGRSVDVSVRPRGVAAHVERGTSGARSPIVRGLVAGKLHDLASAVQPRRGPRHAVPRCAVLNDRRPPLRLPHPPLLAGRLPPTRAVTVSRWRPPLPTQAIPRRSPYQAARTIERHARPAQFPSPQSGVRPCIR